jgi:amino acid adenylation domain-containing protein
VYPEAFSPHRIGSSASVQLKREQFMSAPSHNPGVFPLHAPQVEEVNSPRYSCVHELLEAAAQGRPESIAVEFEGRSLTYAELHARANQLARVLRRRGVQPEVLVGVCMERSLEMEVALLGILKAGGAYVPLDSSFGPGRIQYVLGEARVKVLLTQKSLRSSLPPTSAQILCLESSWDLIANESDQPVPSEGGPSNLAYVIYTSGSTGKPKGVQVQHRSLANLLCSMREEPGMNERDVMLAITTISFDLSVPDIFLPLLAGARLVIASREATFDGKLLRDLLNNSGATFMQATPTTWHILLESGWSGDHNLKAIVGGEAVSPELARKLAACCGSVWNMYGPTETTVWSSLYRVDGREERSVPIGKPIANTSLYVLGPQRESLPCGSEGELYIGGDGLARGYFERPELTAEKFVPDPFSSRAGARMYRTGDLARYRPDGNVEFLGRVDHQVKIRGFRIELGEIEAVLEQHPAVQKAIAVARDGDSSSKYLAAYFIPRSGVSFSQSDLRQHLRKQLPEYMIPSALVALRGFPLSPNGKVDRKTLPAPQASDYQRDHEYLAPRDKIERKLVAIWEDLLGVKPIGVKDGFFDLGGKSLQAARLFTKIISSFGKELPLTTLIHAPTVELLANAIRPLSKDANYPTLVPMKKTGTRPPFFCIHGGAGSTLFMHRVGAKMDAEQPFYGIEPEGMDGRQFRNTTLEEIAAYYLSEIRRVQPAGPYCFGGYCFGGIVAYEMAQQLLRQGEPAALVVLLTAELRFHRKVPAPVKPKPPAKAARHRLATLLKNPARTLYRISAAALAKRWEQFAPRFYRIWFRFGLRIPPKMRTLYVWRTLIRAERNYVPKPFPGAVVMFHGSDYDDDPSLGWDGLAANIEHHVIGNSSQDERRDLMNEPWVNQTARELSDCIARACDAAEFKPTQIA